VDGRLLAIFVVLYVLCKATIFVGGEDAAMTSVFIEGIAVDIVGRLLGGE
jgi:hypothetical protein